MEKIDDKRRCSVEGCTNLGDIHKVVNHKVFRRKLCWSHKNKKYDLPLGPMQSRFRKNNRCDKCDICGWDGPCDVHRKIQQGKYNAENMMSSCPNCHRLIHRGLLSFDGEKWIRTLTM
jgi:quinolinate synthase